MSDRRRFALAVSPALLVVAAAIVVAAVAVLRLDVRGDRENSAANLDVVPKIDPALIAYEQTAEWTLSKLGMKQCGALAVGPDDSVYVGGDRTIFVLRPAGQESLEIPLDAPPQCLAVSGSETAHPGRMYVGLEDRVEVLNAWGKRIAAWKPLPGEASISGIAVGERDVFVADAGNHIVWRFDTSGRLLGRIGEPNEKQNYPGFLVTSRCFPLALGADGLLYVANPRALRVEAFTFGGDMEFSWGKGSAGVEGFFGCCNPAYLATMPDGRFVTVEKGARRVKVYSAQGKFECVVAELDRPGGEPGPVAIDRQGRSSPSIRRAARSACLNACRPARGKGSRKHERPPPEDGNSTRVRRRRDPLCGAGRRRLALGRSRAVRGSGAVLPAKRSLRRMRRAEGLPALPQAARAKAAAAGRQVWQIDPDKCIACDRCQTHCVLDISAVKSVQCFALCGYCDVCTGYFPTKDFVLETGAENQLCPTGAIVRRFIEEKGGERFFEYTINESLCIGCGKCVLGCRLMNGSLYLQIRHDRCVNCNECSIAVACPTQAIGRVPIGAEYAEPGREAASAAQCRRRTPKGDGKS